MSGDLTGRLLGGRYRVTGTLGRGGMGVVCKAVDEVLGREVAVKVLRAYTDSSGPELADLRVRMQREARAAARIRHSGVITVHDVTEESGLPVIVMELIEGRSLDDLIDERGVVEPLEAAGIGAKVADALGAGHHAGVLHRDVKPGNVLLDHDGRVVLTDFGIASMEAPGDDATTKLTRSGELIGSLDYLAPERAQGQEPGPASDIWALGMTLYAAVEGSSPFRRTSVWSTLTAIVTEPLPEPRRAGPLTPVLHAMMDKDPAARPSAGQARVMLEAVAAGEDPQAAAGWAGRTPTAPDVLGAVAPRSARTGDSDGGSSAGPAASPAGGSSASPPGGSSAGPVLGPPGGSPSGPAGDPAAGPAFGPAGGQFGSSPAGPSAGLAGGSAASPPGGSPSGPAGDPAAGPAGGSPSGPAGGQSGGSPAGSPGGQFGGPAFGPSEGSPAGQASGPPADSSLGSSGGPAASPSGGPWSTQPQPPTPQPSSPLLSSAPPGFGPPQVPEEPLVSGGAPGGAGPGRPGRKKALVAAMVVAVLLAGGGVTYALVGDDGDKTAAGSQTDTSASPSHPASPDGGKTGDKGRTDGKDDEDGKGDKGDKGGKRTAEPSGSGSPSASGRPGDSGNSASGGSDDDSDGGKDGKGGGGGGGGDHGAAGGGGAGGGSADPDPAPVCHDAGGGKYNCEVWRAATSYTASGEPVGTLNQGLNYFYCQQNLGRRETYGKWTNVWWAKTDDDSGHTNVFISDVYIKGGDNDQPLPGLPVC
ncbi:serine/threonine-protein kinase [Streptomyces milbemycinicus]|uniref:serine/threonine-protein kinase n=1 Tax=Streptomyces milbemycinicus TaxID=476552 RepID=UPI0033C7AA5B